MENVAAKKHIKIDYETKNGLLKLNGPPAKNLALTPDLASAYKIVEDARVNKVVGTGFTEVMEGYIYAGGDIKDFKVAENVARGNSSLTRFFLSINAWDLDQRKTYSFCWNFRKIRN